MAFFLGIDGGGTKTSCLIGDEKSVLGAGTGGASNVLRVGEAQAQTSLVTAIRQACHVAKIDPAYISRTYMGAAGAARPEVADIIRKILAKTVSGDIEIVGDIVIALHAAFGAGPGIVVIAGTGSVAYGRNAKGETARVGGWGAAVSDEGSGNWIGRRAVAATLRDADKNSASEDRLLLAIMRAWSCESRDELVLAASVSPGPDFATLFPVVSAAADSGDELAARILRLAGKELAALANTVMGRLFSGAEEIPVAMCGGVFGNSALVREVFCNELRRDCSRLLMEDKIVNPVRGALDLARNPGHRTSS